MSAAHGSPGPALAAEAPIPASRPVEARRSVAAAHRPRDYLMRRALAAADLAGVMVGTSLALALSSSQLEPSDLLLIAPALVVWLALFAAYGLYERDVKRVNASPLDDLPALFHSFVLGTLLLGLYVQLVSERPLQPFDAIAFGGAGIVSALLLRAVARRLVLRLSGRSRVLLVGRSTVSEALVRRIRAHPEYGLELVGEVLLTGREDGAASLPYLGRLDGIDLAGLVVAHDVERVVVAAQELGEEAMMALVHDSGAGAAKVSILPSHVNALGPSVEIDDIEGITLLGLNPLVLSRSSRVLKRTLDLGGASLGALITAPLMLVIAVAIKLDSPGPVLFRQRRIGRGGRPFTVFKFRTMVADAEQRAADLRSLSGDPDWLKLDRDPRVTRVGRVLRGASLDELPQLWNVIVGSMSLVGPRPLIASEDELIDGWSRTRLDLSPGVTGLWQVLGRADIPFREMVSLDYLYVTNWSLWLDLKLIARTVPAVISRRGAN